MTPASFVRAIPAPEVRRRSFLAAPSMELVIVLVAVRLVLLVVVLQMDHGDDVADVDVRRFDQIATTSGTPYRDFPVEYMPIELVTIRSIAGGGTSSTATRLAILSFVGELAAAAAIGFGWGRRGAVMYLLLGLPLQTFLLHRIDPMVVALAAWSMALARRHRDGPSGVALGLAVLTKLWPVVLIPWFVLGRRWRATAWCVTVVFVGAIAWVAIGGLQGPWQVLSFRGARGWEVESTIGSVLWLATGGPVRLERGAVRIGTAPLWARSVLLGSIAAVVARIWLRARGQAFDPAGAPALAAVTTLIALSPLFSVQYACWVVPWAAVASLGGRRERNAAAIAFAIVVLCGVLGALFSNPATAATITSIELIVPIRNVLCVGLVVYWLSTGGRRAASNAAPIVPF